MKFTITSQTKQKAVDYILKLPENKVFTISISLKKEKRTIDQNKLYWLWLGCISQETGNDVNTLHELFKEMFLGFEIKEAFGRKTEVKRSTTELDTKGMTDYLNHVQSFAAQEGIILPNPEDLYFDEFLKQYDRYIN